MKNKDKLTRYIKADIINVGSSKQVLQIVCCNRQYTYEIMSNEYNWYIKNDIIHCMYHNFRDVFFEMIRKNLELVINGVRLTKIDLVVWKDTKLTYH